MPTSQYAISFNKPFLTGKECGYVQEAIQSGKLSGNGQFTQRCQHYFERRYGFNKCLLTNSCTQALEMAALLLDIREGDEVIMPAFTFPSTANAFVLRGAKIVFADSREDHPGMDECQVEVLITPRTKAIVAVHYAGVACDMDRIMALAGKHGLYVVEDAAHAIDAYYRDRPLGSFGHLAAFSFHETKNIHCGEGGMLVINDTGFVKRAEILWEKGTDRIAFSRGEVPKYQWMDIGSSFLPSEITAAFLWAQLERMESIQTKRKALWNAYNTFFRSGSGFGGFSEVKFPFIPSYAINNAHMYYLVFENQEARATCIKMLGEAGIMAIFHYQSLHQSPFYKEKHDGRDLPMADHYSDCLLRLPLFYELDMEQMIGKLTGLLPLGR